MLLGGPFQYPLDSNRVTSQLENAILVAKGCANFDVLKTAGASANEGQSSGEASEVGSKSLSAKSEEALRRNKSAGSRFASSSIRASAMTQFVK